LIGIYSEIMLSRPNLNCYEDEKDVTGSFQDHYEVLCELEEMIKDDFWT
jgi:hypothetical protein